MASRRFFSASSNASIVVGREGRLSHSVRSQSYCVGPCRVSRYKKPTLVPTASIRSVPRWHISMMEANIVWLHIAWPCSAETAAAGIEPGSVFSEDHVLAFGGRHLGQNHSTMMINCATTMPIVRKPQTASWVKSMSWKSGSRFRRWLRPGPSRTAGQRRQGPPAPTPDSQSTAFLPAPRCLTRLRRTAVPPGTTSSL